MDIASYLRRIGYEGSTEPTLATLRAVQRAHATTIPYETFDIFLGRRTTTAPAFAFDKIVGERRGGWCYENNGLLGAALAAMGFPVARMTADNNRPGTHLTLRVEVPGSGSFICDPGLSDSPLEPFALAAGAFAQNGFEYRLELPASDRFRFVNHRLGLVPSYEARPAGEDDMAEACAWLQTSPQSMFVSVPIVCIHEPDGTVRTLVGRTTRTVRPDRIESRTVESVDAYLEILRTTFKLDLPQAADLWPRIVRAHEEREQSKAQAPQA